MSSLNDVPADLGDRNLGIQPLRLVTDGPNDTRAISDSEVVTVEVPVNPRVLDLARAYAETIRVQAELAEEAVLGAELDAANAQRIAAGARMKAERLRARHEELLAQIDRLYKLECRVV